MMADTTTEILKGFQELMKSAGMSGFILMIAKRPDGDLDTGYVTTSMAPIQILAPLSQVTANFIRNTLESKPPTDLSAYDGLGPFEPPA